LWSLGLEFSWAATEVDETQKATETADAMVLRLAVAKARAAGDLPSSAVLGADTAVVLGSQVLGKPDSPEDAARMLARLSGQTHRVMTGVALISGGVTRTALSISAVKFRDIAATELRAYCRTGEFSGKAGAYAIQGLAGLFVESLHGSYSGVVGLPVYETAGLLRAAGMDILRMTKISGLAL
jgi:septum formation protein